MTEQKSIVQSSCAYCGVGCGVDINVTNNEATAIKGSSEHPANYGRLCVKGTKLLETISDDNRLLAPEINNEPVSWQAASRHVANTFADTIAKYGKDSVAFYVSGQLLTEDYYVANKLMKGYIGSGNIDTNSRLCMSSAVSAYKRSFGEDIVPCSYDDIETTELLLITGSNLAWTHPVLFQRIERAKQINPTLKVVLIDPRKTASSELADHFLAIKPGTDAAFFNGLLHYLSINNGIDEQYVKNHTEGIFSALEEAKNWSLAKVSAFCELDEAELSQVYQLFSQASKAVSFYSMGINQSSSGVDKCNSIINCHLASGKIGREGCGPFSITGQPNAMGGREVGGLANQLTAHLDIENEQHRHYVQNFWQSPTMVTEQGKKAVEMFDAIKSGKIKAVWIMATNPLVSLPDRKQIEQALKVCPFVVVSDCVKNNDTLAYADVKLAATPWLEKNGTVTNSERRISRQRSVVRPTGQARHDWQIIADIAKSMGFDGFDYTDVSQVFSEFSQLTAFNQQSNRLFDISGLSGLTAREYDQLKPIQWPVTRKQPQGGGRVYADGKFATASGKAQFIKILPRLPEQRTSAALPMLLNSGRLRDHWHSMTRTGNSASLSQHIDKPYLYLHRDDLHRHGLVDGQLAEINGVNGQVIVPTKVDDNLRRGECFLPLHWNMQFASHANISALYAPTVDAISGQPESKQAAVNIKASQYRYFGECHIRCANTATEAFKSDFWIKSTTSYGCQFTLAFETQLNDQLQWCQQQLSLATHGSGQGEWLTFGDEDAYYIICLEKQALVFVGYFGRNQPQTEPSWLAHVFSKDSLAFSDIQALLIGQASSEFAKGKQICSCFGVGEKDIVAAISAGCDSVEALGENLKCGTNCGSCKPELAQLLQRHRETADVAHKNIITTQRVG